MDSLMRDLRHGLRRVVAAPGFAAIAVLTLALGIGANVAIFTVVNAVLICAAAVSNPDRLVRHRRRCARDEWPATSASR
jgi:putative ABC transport system permease protein